ncbi:MAG: hypothetical protein JSR77_08980, partial [Planctomycetes bacterium]|nr:hypothetical protein [Planctomycetota bacterium]
DKVTQQNAGNSEELASGAEETAAQVTSLQELVKQFKTNGDSHTTATTRTAKTPTAGRTRGPKTVKSEKATDSSVSKRNSLAASAPGKGVAKPTPAATAIPMTDEEESLASF